MSDGHLNKCKECTKTDVKVNREENSEYYQAFDRVRAREPERREAKRKYQQREDVQVLTREYKRRSAAKYSKRKAANTAVGNAVRDGVLHKEPCFICGNAKVEAHHPDYDTPLSVVWLCVPHHKEIHREYDEVSDKEILSK